MKQNFFLELVFIFGIKISEEKIFLKCKSVMDWNQGLTKLEFDTEDQVLCSLFSQYFGCRDGGRGEGYRGHFYVFALLHVSEHSEHFCFWLLLWCEKINYFHGWGVPPSPPFAENPAKIINLIFEPFPKIVSIMIITCLQYFC